MKRFSLLVLSLIVGLLVSCATVAEVEEVLQVGAMEEKLVVDTASLSLYKTYQDKGIKIGTDLNAGYINDAWAEATLLQDFNIFTPSYELKPNKILSQGLSQENGKLTIVLSDEMIECLDWAKENGKSIHGHTMIWWKDTPDWIFREGFADDGAYVSRDVLIERMEGYIMDTFAVLTEGGWIESFDCYDIVNEYIDINGKAPNETPWVSIIGDDAIFYAFKFARKYAPKHISLVYNENFCENNAAKRDATIQMVQKLVDEEGRPLIDCLGLQCHLSLSNNINKICDNIRIIAQSIGDLQLQVTELDCTFMVKEQTAQQKLRQQGTYYYQVMETLLDLVEGGTKLTAVATCGFRDDTCWLGAQSAPVLFDVNGVQKYSYFGLMQVREYSGFDD